MTKETQETKETLSKEQLLDYIKDLVQTLQGANLENEKIVQLWRGKLKKVEHSLGKLDKQDLNWLWEQYASWHREKIEPLMTKDMKRFARDNDLG